MYAERLLFIGRLWSLRSVFDVVMVREFHYHAYPGFFSCVCFAESQLSSRLTFFRLQIFGGNGFNSEYPVEKLMRDAKIFQVSLASSLLCYFFVTDSGTNSSVFGKSSFIEAAFWFLRAQVGFLCKLWPHHGLISCLETLRQYCVAHANENFMYLLCAVLNMKALLKWLILLLVKNVR